MEPRNLTFNDIKTVMSQKILIGCDSKYRKEFVYLPYTEDYQVWHKNKLIKQGKGSDIDELLESYNSLRF